jgi:PAS domain-containing protein
MSVLATDVDPRLRALELEIERLARERRRYAVLFELAPDACLVTDAEGTIREANVAAGLLLGAAPASLAGKTLESFVPLEQRRVFSGKVAVIAAGDVGRLAWQGTLCGEKERLKVEFGVSAIRHALTPMRSLCWMLRQVG